MASRHLRALVLVCAGAGTVTAISLVALPFYGLAEPNGQLWPFDIVSSTTAIGSQLSFNPALPGSQLLASVTVAVAVLTVVLALVSYWTTDRLHLTVTTLAVASTALVALMVVELLARPPFGDGPPLRYTWGAVVGVVFAVVACIAAWLATKVGVTTPEVGAAGTRPTRSDPRPPSAVVANWFRSSGGGSTGHKRGSGDI